jgi:redox-sensitive bicupin YhaK (pirin superfamily)
MLSFSLPLVLKNQKNMLTKIPARQIYIGDYGWHVARFHFSFADYDDPWNAHFGDLITFNDFTLQPHTGFETHPHQEMEIISYCVNGELVHEDSMGNKEIIKRGEMQYTCAGSGITHSERNDSLAMPLRFIQIWIRPNAAGLPPQYSATHLQPSERCNKLLQVVSGRSIQAVTRINQDANIYISEMEAGKQLHVSQLPGRQLYLACLEGSLDINNLPLESGDAIKGWDELGLTLTAMEDCHLVMVEMPRIFQ